MILGLQRRTTLLAMMRACSVTQMEEACDCLYSTIEMASEGKDVPTWEGHNIVDAIDAWDSKGRGLP